MFAKIFQVSSAYLASLSFEKKCLTKYAEEQNLIKANLVITESSTMRIMKKELLKAFVIRKKSIESEKQTIVCKFQLNSHDFISVEAFSGEKIEDLYEISSTALNPLNFTY